MSYKQENTDDVDDHDVGRDSSTETMVSKFKIRRFSMEEIIRATENFCIKIGEGGFGPVFRGNMEDGSQIAVKVLSHFSRQGKQEFLNEIKLLAFMDHRNLVSLRGFCIDDGEQMLVYEYLAQGSLQHHLHGPNSEGREQRVLKWRDRIQVALDAAHGLEHLHIGCSKRFIHRDIKSSNILLDLNFRGKLADFGLAKGMTGHEALATLVKGTPGYLDPEYCRTEILTEKSDVYSLGVVLLEIICGRPAVNKHLPKEEINIVQWVKPHINKRKGLMKIIDKRLMDGISGMNSVSLVARLAMRCLAEDGSCRPSSSEVVMGLKQALQEEDSITHQASFSVLIQNISTIFSRAKNKALDQEIVFDVNDEPLFGSLTRFTLEELISATRNFSKSIGEGKFGSVFLGHIKDECPIAVKVFSADSKQTFLNELALLGRVRNLYLLCLLGYCTASDRLMLVYEHTNRNSLSDLHYGNLVPNEEYHHRHSKFLWRNNLRKLSPDNPYECRISLSGKLKIAADIAEGLEYLHETCSSEIHLLPVNITASNIFVDVKNGGWSKLALFHVSSKAHATMDSKSTRERHFYELGLLLIQLLRCNNHPENCNAGNIERPGNEADLPLWVTKWQKQGRRPSSAKTITGWKVGNLKSQSQSQSDGIVYNVAHLAMQCVSGCPPYHLYPPYMLLDRWDVINSAADISHVLRQVIIKYDTGAVPPGPGECY